MGGGLSGADFQSLAGDSGKVSREAFKKQLGGSAAFSIPLALNEPKGEWRLRFTDVASGAREERAVEVR